MTLRTRLLHAALSMLMLLISRLPLTACGEISGMNGYSQDCSYEHDYSCGSDGCQHNACTCGECTFCVSGGYSCDVLFDCCTWQPC